MYIIYKTAMKIASENKSVIIRLDIQFNFDSQAHLGYLVLSNEREYNITSEGVITKITA